MKRFQFSLGTLVLAVLTIAGGLLVWWNCVPWRPAFSLPSYGWPEEAEFVTGDQCIAIYRRWWRDGYELNNAPDVSLYDARSGKQLLELHATLPRHSDPKRDMRLDVLDDPHFFCVKESNSSHGLNRLLALRRFTDGDDFLARYPALANVQFFGLLCDATLAIIREDAEADCKIVRFPSLEPVCRTGVADVYEIKVSPDKAFAALYSQKDLRLVSLKDGRLLETFHANGSIAGFEFSPDGKRFGWTDSGYNSKEYVVKSNYRLHVFDLAAMKVTQEFPMYGMHFWFCDCGRKLVHGHHDLQLYDFELDKSVLLEDHTSTDSAKFSDDMLLLPGKIWDTRTGAMKHVEPGSWNHAFYFLCGDLKQSVRILDLRTGENTGQISVARWPTQLPHGFPEIHFAKRADSFITGSHKRISDNNEHEQRGSFTVWKRSGPNRWWEFTTMPEFWVTAMLGITMTLNILRNRRRHRLNNPLPGKNQ